MVTSYCHLGHVVNSNLDDSPDIINRHCSFIGQVNSVLCFFGKLSSGVKSRLFRSYCTSFYGCELWNLSCAQLADLCTKWRKSVQRVLNLPLQTHCYLLPLLCQCLRVYDEICGRTMNFVRSCLYHQYRVVKSVAWYSVLHGRYSFPIGRNVLLCLQRYKCTFNDFLSCHSFKNIICRFVSAGCTDDQYNACSMLSECLRVRDDLLKLPDCFSQSDINDIILYLSMYTNIIKLFLKARSEL